MASVGAFWRSCRWRHRGCCQLDMGVDSYLRYSSRSILETVDGAYQKLDLPYSVCPVSTEYVLTLLIRLKKSSCSVYHTGISSSGLPRLCRMWWPRQERMGVIALLRLKSSSTSHQLFPCWTSLAARHGEACCAAVSRYNLTWRRWEWLQEVSVINCATQQSARLSSEAYNLHSTLQDADITFLNWGGHVFLRFSESPPLVVARSVGDAKQSRVPPAELGTCAGDSEVERDR